MPRSNRQILDLPQRQRISDIHHHRQTDYLGRAVEISEGIFHPRGYGQPLPGSSRFSLTMPSGDLIFLNPILSDTATSRPRHGEWGPRSHQSLARTCPNCADKLQTIMESPTQDLATFVSALDARSFPPRLCSLVSQHVLEGIAGVYASTRIPAAGSVARMLGDDEAVLPP